MVASGALTLQVILGALAAFIIEDMDFWRVSPRFALGVHFLVGGDHVFVLAVFHCNHKNRIEFVYTRNKNVVLPVIGLYRKPACQVPVDGTIVSVTQYCVAIYFMFFGQADLFPG